MTSTLTVPTFRAPITPIPTDLETMMPLHSIQKLGLICVSTLLLPLPVQPISEGSTSALKLTQKHPAHSGLSFLLNTLVWEHMA